LKFDLRTTAMGKADVLEVVRLMGQIGTSGALAILAVQSPKIITALFDGTVKIIAAVRGRSRRRG
jgi:hypothetical protein